MRRFLSFGLLLLLCTQTLAAIEERLTLTGEARFRYLFMTIYDASLYTPAGEYAFFDTLPFVLKLTYARNFKSQHIINETRRQWQQLGFTHPLNEQWLQALENMIPDIADSDQLTLTVDDTGSSFISHNGKTLGAINNPEFSRQFAAIWLSPGSTEPNFTARLTGESQ